MQKYKVRPLHEEGGCFIFRGDVWELIKAEDLQFYLDEGQDSEGFPPNGLVISHNRCGDYLFYLTNVESPNLDDSVYLYNHETLENFCVGKSIKRILNEIYPIADYAKLLDIV